MKAGSESRFSKGSSLLCRVNNELRVQPVVLLTYVGCGPPGPVQHGASVLAPAGQRWRLCQSHDGGVPAFTPPLAVRGAAQTGTSPPNTTCTHVTPPPTQTPALTVFLQLSGVLSTGAVSDEGILETMRRCWEENLYLLCPHTAVAVWHHYHCPHSWGVNRSDLPSHFL